MFCYNYNFNVVIHNLNTYTVKNELHQNGLFIKCNNFWYRLNINEYKSRHTYFLSCSIVNTQSFELQVIILYIFRFSKCILDEKYKYDKRYN